jgi:protein SCO1/2
MFKSRLFSLYMVGFVLLLSACGGSSLEKPDDLDWEVQDFSFTNQDEETVGLENLDGRVWLANFIFTSCTTVCPPMTMNMAQIQSDLKEEGLDASIVSFSVDPEVDTPEKLKDFAGNFNADFSNWHFLTGYPQDDIKKLAKDSFKSIVENEPDSDQVMHATSFFLVDQNGTIVTRYSGNQEVPYEQIVQDIKALTQ